MERILCHWYHQGNRYRYRQMGEGEDKVVVMEIQNGWLKKIFTGKNWEEVKTSKEIIEPCPPPVEKDKH